MVAAGVGEGHVGAVGAVAFARRSGSFLVTGGADKLLKVGGWAGGWVPLPRSMWPALPFMQPGLQRIDCLRSAMDPGPPPHAIPSAIHSPTLEGESHSAWRRSIRYFATLGAQPPAQGSPTSRPPGPEKPRGRRGTCDCACRCGMPPASTLLPRRPPSSRSQQPWRPTTRTSML